MPEPLVGLYEDAHVLAVDKPAGRLTQGRRGGEETLEDDARAYLNPDAPASVYLGAVHRLDRPVSGVVLLAKTPKAARRLAAQFSAREVTKEYWAVVEARPGFPEPGSEGVWDDWLLGSTDVSGAVRGAAEGDPAARRAVTRFRRESARAPEGCVRLRLWPETGRTHQLRAQAALRGWPVVGDAVYGSTRDPAGPAVALHARSVVFRHPTLGRPVTVVAPLPETWRERGWLDAGPGVSRS